MDVYTTQPGVQFYSGNKLSGSEIGKGGKAYPKYGGLCLERSTFRIPLIVSIFRVRN